MINVKFDLTALTKDINSAVQYSDGYLEGIQLGKVAMLKELGYSIKKMLEEFIDVSARVDPARLHHVYEWYMAGQPEARLFNLECSVIGDGLTISSTFSQSKSFSHGSNVPFYDKAQIMEAGIPVTITPKNAKVLAFSDEADGMIFTKGPVVINHPGGRQVQGSFHDIINEFFDNYFSQSFLNSSGFAQQIKSTEEFYAGFGRSRSEGVKVGYNWILKAGNSLW
jgi:hypothetical protein